MPIRIRADKRAPGVRFDIYTTTDRELDSPRRHRREWPDDPPRPPAVLPPDGVRNFVPVEPVRKVDPPVRRHFVNSLPPHKRATALILGYVEKRVGSVDKDESRACRGFLSAYHAIVADGNEMGVDLAVMRVDAMSVQFFFNIHGVGPCVRLPVLVTAANEHTHHIMRETGPDRVVAGPCRNIPSDPDQESRRRIPPKVETVLIRGK